MNTSFFGELLQVISDRGRALVDRTRGRRGAGPERSESLVDLCEELVSVRGEASGTALARDILTHFAELTTGPRIAFFEALAHRFGPDTERITRAVEAWRDTPSDATAAELHGAAEPRRHEGAGAHAREADGCDGPPRGPRRGRCRFRPSLLVLVQPRLSGAAPHRL